VLGAMLSGGKLFDDGEYGCIFTPPLECKTKTKQVLAEDGSELPLSKLILTDDAEHEYGISKVIRQIPLWKNYFVVSESICEPAAQQKDKELKDCPVLDTYKLSDFRILSMPYGGVPLNLYRMNLAKLDFMSFIVHFIEGGALLNLFGIVHRDIHQGNILVDDEQVPRIIDFNLSIPVQSNVTANLLSHTYNITTGQEPPDSTLVNAISKGYNPERVIESIINKKPIIRKIQNILGVNATSQLQSLEGFYLDSKAAKTGNTVKWFNNYWRTIDSWAIGVNILVLISKLSLWPEFSQTLRRVKPKLFPVLRGLCEVSPTKRLDCVQALNMLSPNSFIIRKYGKAWLAKVGST
jgi:serine/threonine protein kinase